MRTRPSLLLWLCPVMLSIACDGFAPVRLSEMETWNGNTTTVKEVSYGDDGRIEEIETRRNGDFVGRLELLWDGGRIDELVYEQRDEEKLNIKLSYEGSRLVEMHAKRGDTDYRIGLEYLDDDPGFLSEYQLVIQEARSRTTETRTIEYEDGRAVVGKHETTFASASGSLSTTNELKVHWRDGLPDEVRITSKAFGVTSRRDAELVFADDGRIEEVEYDDGETIEISYDDEGRIEEVEIREDDGDRVVHELRYESGSQSGFAFVAPGLPAGELFDLTGRALERPDVFTDAWFPTP